MTSSDTSSTGPLAGIRILDMTRTAVNITGDAVCTCIIAQGEGGLDKDVFNAVKNADFERSLEDNVA